MDLQGQVYMEHEKDLYFLIQFSLYITKWVAVDIKVVEVVDNIGYVGAFDDGVLIYDFSDPTTPIFLGEHYDGGETSDIDIIGNLAFVADGTDGLEVLDITDPANLVEVAQFNDGGAARNVFVEGNVAYVAEGEDGLEIIKIDGLPETITSQNTITTPTSISVLSISTDSTMETITGSESSPSFELIPVLILLSIFLVVRKKKRKQRQLR